MTIGSSKPASLRRGGRATAQPRRRPHDAHLLHAAEFHLVFAICASVKEAWWSFE